MAATFTPTGPWVTMSQITEQPNKRNISFYDFMDEKTIGKTNIKKKIKISPEKQNGRHLK